METAAVESPTDIGVADSLSRSTVGEAEREQ